MKDTDLDQVFQSDGNTQRMPVLFIGHGSPLNAIEVNEFSKTWRNIGETIPKPKAILCISAHWETNGTLLTAMQSPPTIHDFGGFPQELFDVQYPAPGSPELAYHTQKLVSNAKIGLDTKWGLDHGAWSVLKHIYPHANIPVVEMSLDFNCSPWAHYELGKELAVLRNKGVLIVGSGNLVHNLRKVAWEHANDPEYGFDWALNANDTFKQLISSDKHKELANYQQLGTEVQMAVPTPDHYLPLMYILALKEDMDQLTFFNDKAVMGSLTMTSVKFG